jgi:uncharacterized membrane protein
MDAKTYSRQPLSAQYHNSFRYGAGIVVLLFFLLFLFLGFSRHWGNGEFFLNTSQLNRPIIWLGFHFHPIYLLFVPFYYLIPHVIWFIIAQAVSLSLSALPIYYLARHVCASERAGLLWMLVYLMNPILLNTAAFDFFPVSIAIPFISLSLLSIEMKRSRLLILSALIILLCKEHFGVMVAGFGGLWWIHNKRWKTSAVLILLGVMHSVILLGVIMPALSPTHSHIMLGDDLDQLSRYSWLGNSFKEIFLAIFSQPVYIAKMVMLELGGLKYMALLLAFFLGFPLAAPQFLLPGFGDLLANMLSFNPLPRSVLAYHSITLVPILTVAAIFGVKKLSLRKNWINRRSAVQLSIYAFCTSMIFGYFLAPLPLPWARNNFAPVNLYGWPDPEIKTIRSAIGYQASVSAQSNIGAHFTQRKEIYRYPNKVGAVDAVILRLDSPTKNINNIPKEFTNQRKYLSNVLDGYLQMDRTDYLGSIESIIHGKDYGILLWHDPWLVLMTHVKSHRQEKKVEQKLEQLREEWKIKPQ